MKTLYISDLDGTLLNSQKKISSGSLQILNHLLDHHVLFTLSTARTIASSFLWSELRLTTPVSTTNGALLISPNHEVLSCKSIGPEDFANMMMVLEDFPYPALLYTLQENMELCYYRGTPHTALQKFIEERSVPPFTRYKKFVSLKPHQRFPDVPVFFVSVMGEYHSLQALKQELCQKTNLHVHCYQDIYHPEFYFLELCASGASKATSALELASQVGADKLVVFGDNTNDLPMFSVADECYATANATEDAKQAATAIIGHCDEDGVALWMKENCKI